MKEKLTNQHGDVLVFRISELPAELKPAREKDGKYILAEGEATGHAHAICDIDNCDLFVDEAGNLFLEAKAPVELTHEEHAAQTILPGTYRISRVREVDPFSEEIRQVTD